MQLRNWPSPSIYEPLPWPVEVEDGLMFSEHSQALECANRVRSNGHGCTVWTFPGNRGVYVEIRHAS